MKKEQIIALVIGILCALAVVGVGIGMLVWQEDAPAPGKTPGTTQQTAIGGETNATKETTETQDTQETTGTDSSSGTEETKQTEKEDEDSTQSTEDKQEETPAAPPVEDLPPMVEISPEKDPQTGEPEKLTFPCVVPGYDLTLEKLAPFDGMYVEDGTNANVTQVAMLMVKNNGDYPIEYAQISVEYGEAQLIFDISALPAGETLVVQEKTRKSVPQGDVTKAQALVVQRAEMEMSQEQIRVTDNGDNTITVENLTDQTIPTTRVFYKYFMKDENLFVGGIAFTVRLWNMPAGGKMTIQPAHYNSTTGRVVMVRTYDQ